MRSGSSWSGHERNCGFLNLGNSEFANVSAAAGLDFADDARAIAVTDWDRDGDIDFWIANRTAPRVRFLRNNATVGQHFLTVKLIGVTCNRDAIGARLTLNTNERTDQLISKSIRSGEGFLSQSSRVVTFGLGESNQPRQLEIHWPDGLVQNISNLNADHHYVITQGEPPVQDDPAAGESLRLATSKQTVQESTAQTRLIMLDRKTFPPIDYQQRDGEMASLSRFSGRPLLVNLWASWCPHCLSELTDFGRHAAEIQERGLNILALSVDNVDGITDHVTDDTTLQKAFAKYAAPFSGGFVSKPLLQMLERGPGLFLNRNAPLPLPSSFLFDSQGQIAAIYTGPVTSKQLLADVDLLDAPRSQLMNEALPFSGRWLDERFTNPVVHAVAASDSPVQGATEPAARSTWIYVVAGAILIVILVTLMRAGRRGRE